MNIHESAEDYLEKILMLQEKKGSVRSIDIAVAMGFSKPSVSVAMKNLRENGYISMDPDGFIKLEAPAWRLRSASTAATARLRRSLWRWVLTLTSLPRTPARWSMT